MPGRRAPLVAAVILLAPGSCVREVPPPNAPAAPTAVTISGRVTYERRRPTDQGLTLAVETMPARHVLVEAVDLAGAAIARTSTDDAGRYELHMRPSGAITVRASSIIEDECDVRVLRSPVDRQPHRIGVTGTVRGRRAVTQDLHATVGQDEPAGAFHIVDLLLDGYRAVRSTAGVTLPPLIGLWRRGNTRNEAVTSFFRGESTATPGAFELQLMGGAQGEEDRSDSDQFDDGIILHEFGHFVFRALGAEASVGGSHDRRRSMVPGVAFEEAFVTFFACAVLRDPLYLDTVGVEPNGSVRASEDMEDAGDVNLRGVGTETTTFELLWDLADAPGGDLRDRDGDGVSIGLGAIMRVLHSFERDQDDYPYIGLFLKRAMDMGLLTEPQVVALIKDPRPQNLSWPPRGSDVWPTDISLPAAAQGKIDGLTEPSTAGGAPDPHNGFDAVHTYRFRLTTPQTVRARLTIEGTGRTSDHEDLDLELYDINTRRLAAATSESSVEQITRELTAGSYVLYVRDGGQRNRASYRLEVEATAGSIHAGP